MRYGLSGYAKCPDCKTERASQSELPCMRGEEPVAPRPLEYGRLKHAKCRHRERVSTGMRSASVRHDISRRWLRKRKSLIGGMALVLCWLTLSPALAQKDEVIAKGKHLYQRACAVCHGNHGRGDGTMAEHLQSLRPADLTQIKKQHGGQFPFWQMYQIIDGRKNITGHGPRDMPIWGDWFRLIEGQDEDAVRGRIWQLLYYLESIQDVLE